MNYDIEYPPFTKSLMAGLFAGLAATTLSLIYNTIFRGVTEFPLSELINVSTVSFSLLLAVTIAGAVFYLFHHYLKKGVLIFQVASLATTAVLIAFSFQANRSGNLIFNTEFRELLTGVIVITGLCISFAIPFFFRHDYI